MIGRKAEIDELERLYNSDESEFIAIYGRRRVGKTYLVREIFENRLAFQHTGRTGIDLRTQLKYFLYSLNEYGLSERSIPHNWEDAFLLLRKLLESNSSSKKKVVFIDEMPWLDTARSNFLSALDGFWNGWCSARSDILLIVCGSAASWMVKNLMRNKGGLHNRLTARMRLQPFSLSECEAYSHEMGLSFTRRDIAEAYMALGGIPYYWRLLDKRFSLAQNMDRLFFAENAPLRNEFSELYSSLFKKAKNYEKVVTILAQKNSGMSFQEISEKYSGEPSGSLTQILETLELSGFVRRYRTIGKKSKDSIYQLIDEFTLFHFRFLGKDGSSDPYFWTLTYGNSVQIIWRGLAFERICLQHLEQIRKALGILGIHVEAYAWYHRPDDICGRGCQIDLLIERSDNVINICEMKYHNREYALNAKSLEEIEEKEAIFRECTHTRAAIHITMITSMGLVRNAFANRIQSDISLDALFDLG